MGIIAWIILGLAVGLLANMLIPGRRPQGLALACAISISGSLLGGWAGTRLFRLPSLHGFYDLQTWMTAVAAASVLLLVYSRAVALAHSRATGRPGQRIARRWPG
jgi:uncharacterized membrane protein YeaQ/YmgE (transglycosylase-associated protein family)